MALPPSSGRGVPGLSRAISVVQCGRFHRPCHLLLAPCRRIGHPADVAAGHDVEVVAGRSVPGMFEWTEEQRMIRDTVRQFVESEIAPRREEVEFGDIDSYDVLS